MNGVKNQTLNILTKGQKATLKTAEQQEKIDNERTHRDTIMNDINNPDSIIYKNALKRTEHISKKLEKSKMNCLAIDLKLVGTEKDILAHLKAGPAKNLVNSFFKYTTDKCDFCNIQKDKSIQLDRAHCNKQNCDRSALLGKSIKKHFVNEQTPIKIKDILKDFIQFHNEIPLFILCKECHLKYDKY